VPMVLFTNQASGQESVAVRLAEIPSTPSGIAVWMTGLRRSDNFLHILGEMLAARCAISQRK
jgi:hypothetical protein